MDAVWSSSSLASDVAVVGSSPSLRCSSDTTKCYAEALRRCGSSQNLWEGKRLHFLLKSRGYDGDTFLGNLLVQMYGKCGELDRARSALDRIVTRNVFSWTILIAYFQNGLFRDALDAYQEMKDDRMEPDDFIFSIALGACGALGTDALEEGRAIHSHLIVASSTGAKAPSFGKSSIVTTGLVDMYAKCGSVEDGAQSLRRDGAQRYRCLGSYHHGLFGARRWKDHPGNVSKDGNQTKHVCLLRSAGRLLELQTA
ncbi:pentatricopeptide repeat-containing protein At2g42920, chloroplastic-like [Selaginella moellendorffii]|uniref:pentatricopeptide repeat-containing protein At2g42920, chloroplastic-like n=1 Tax=Selaginella moellendorffii TaxID=88036 RepID=UPI000D1CB4E8|nr:pentatricopeptide repeat-containing protein At2g42920, chloroplastic-like [Selaginella moellendorffii]|eukprot:XP_024535890.1 pentatricopeptide repeat-containing protein At2g42920, chloroplastic-like [Selaginella moellendorffii]